MRAHFETEAASEATRQMLARNPFFDAAEAFRIVDLNANGLISKDEIRYLMESRGYFISDREARDIAKKFDFNKDGLISYGEFMEEVRPKSPSRRMWTQVSLGYKIAFFDLGENTQRLNFYKF